MTGGRLFQATAHLHVPLDVATAERQATLEKLAHDLMVDITLEDVSASYEPK